MQRSSGVLLAISSLPGPFGIGTLGAEAYRFVDQLYESGTRYWQILPTTPPGYSNSPYASTSCFANNICFIDPRELAKDGYLRQEEIKNYLYTGSFVCKTDYEFANNNARVFLRQAYSNISAQQEDDLQAFVCENDWWLHDYAVYEVLHQRFKGAMWQEWPTKERFRSVQFMTDFLQDEANQAELNLVYFSQWQFALQWKRLRKYANARNVRLIGDMPIFPALDSADVWANRELFQLDENGQTIFKAGVPPDYFSEDGQLWGNPLYDWDVAKNTDYKWWTDRVRHTMQMFDVVRIDHFRGFSTYWAVPGDNKTARQGKWLPGPGMSLFNKLHEEIDDLHIIAEDLGDIDSGVKELLKASGYPGMKVLQFSFDAKEHSSDLPYKWPENAVVYTGTHDNDTTLGWLESLQEDERDYVLRYTRMDKNVDWRIRGPYSPALRSLIETCFASACNLTVIPIQDLLGMDNQRIMNVPGTVNERNWTFRLAQDELESLDIEWLYEINKIYQRLAPREVLGAKNSEWQKNSESQKSPESLAGSESLGTR